MKHVLIAFAFMAIPFARAEKAERKPSSSAWTFKDGTSVESLYVGDSMSAIQIKDGSRVCYAVVTNASQGNSTSISCLPK